MSQNNNETETPEIQECACGPDSFMVSLRAAKKARLQEGLTCGPMYCEGEPQPGKWFDQAFARGITPAGTVNCPTALRVGATQNALDVLLIASHANTGQITVNAGATITASFLQSDSQDGTFEEIGPSICAKAPAQGIAVDPCKTVFRIPIGNFSKPWLKVKLVFAGSISGGTMDVLLGYVPR